MTKEVEGELVDLDIELSVFDPVAKAVEEAKEKNRNLVFDYEDPKGNKDARSYIHDLRRLKAPIAEIHKTAKAEAKRFCDALDAKKRELVGAVEEMIDYHHKPILEIEEREVRKKAEEEARIQAEKEAEEARKQAEMEERERKIREEEEKIRQEKEKLEQAERERLLKEQAEAEAEAKAKAEMERAEQARLRAKEKQAYREADEIHRTQIHTEVYEDLLSKVGILPPDAKAVGKAIVEKKIRHIQILY